LAFSEWLTNNEQALRLFVFLGGFIGFLILGLLFPYRAIEGSQKYQRWVNNSLLTFANSFLLKALMPFTVVFVAREYSSFGALSYISDLAIFKIILGIVVLDFAVYWQHRVFHVVPIFWRLHRVHHTDTEFDVTTALRFHTVEILLSYLIKAIIIVLFGISFESVIIFEVVLNFCAMFNHGNYQIPNVIEKYVRQLLVTPSMHRVHHSVLVNETNSNYGFCLSLWDRMFGSYIPEPKNNPKHMDIGIESFRATSEQSIFKLLVQPFKNLRG